MDNQAALPAAEVARTVLRTHLLGPTGTFISDDKFWCLFDEIVAYVITSVRITNEVLLNATGQQPNGAAMMETLHSAKRSLGI